MTRYFIQLSYKGTRFHGWQYQPNAITVQETLNKALSIILKEDINITGCGRTDTGVHARNYIAHFDSKNIHLESDKLSYKLNGYLPDDVYIRGIYKMANNAHARFDALLRRYKYYLSTKKEIFQNDYCWQFYKPLDMPLMNKAAQILLNHSDFTSFSKLHTDVKTNNCDIKEAYWSKEDEFLVFTITADRFLRNMVRSIVGTLIEVGLHKLTLNEFEVIIEKKNRNIAGVSAPAKGLFFDNIEYPFNFSSGMIK